MSIDVAVVNTAEELAEILELALQQEGLTTARGFTLDFKRGRQDLNVFFQTHEPRVVVWDVAIPYQENWHYAQAVQDLPAAQGRTFILTTTNERALRLLTGETEVCEIIGKPFDLQHVVEAVCAALDDRSPHQSAHAQRGGEPSPSRRGPLTRS